MTPANSSRYQTAFTVSIEAAQGVTTGVSAADRLATVRAAIAEDATPADLNRPGHVFPCRPATAGSWSAGGTPRPRWTSCAWPGSRPTGCSVS